MGQQHRRPPRRRVEGPGAAARRRGRPARAAAARSDPCAFTQPAEQILAHDLQLERLVHVHAQARRRGIAARLPRMPVRRLTRFCAARRLSQPSSTPKSVPKPISDACCTGFLRAAMIWVPDRVGPQRHLEADPIHVPAAHFGVLQAQIGAPRAGVALLHHRAADHVVAHVGVQRLIWLTTQSTISAVTAGISEETTSICRAWGSRRAISLAPAWMLAIMSPWSSRKVSGSRLSQVQCSWAAPADDVRSLDTNARRVRVERIQHPLDHRLSADIQQRFRLALRQGVEGFIRAGIPPAVTMAFIEFNSCTCGDIFIWSTSPPIHSK